MQLVAKSSVLYVTVFGFAYITIVQHKRSVVSFHALFEELSAWHKLNAQGHINFTVSRRTALHTVAKMF